MSDSGVGEGGVCAQHAALHGDAGPHAHLRFGDEGLGLRV
jgi:hypothetical protein